MKSHIRKGKASGSTLRRIEAIVRKGDYKRRRKPSHLILTLRGEYGRPCG